MVLLLLLLLLLLPGCGCCHYGVATATVAGPPTCNSSSSSLDCFVAVIATVCPQLATTCRNWQLATSLLIVRNLVRMPLRSPPKRMRSNRSRQQSFVFSAALLPLSPSPSLSLALCLARSLVALALTGRTINVFASVWGCATFWGIQMWPQLSRNENFNFLSSAFIAHNYKSPKAVAAASGQPPRYVSAPATCLCSAAAAAWRNMPASLLGQHWLHSIFNFAFYNKCVSYHI